MAGGKRGHAKRKQLPTQGHNPKSKALERSAEKGQKKKHVRARARKRARRVTPSSEQSYVPPKKRVRASLSGNRRPAAAKAEGHHRSDDAKASSTHNSPRDPESPPTRLTGPDTYHLAKSGREQSPPATKSDRRRSFHHETKTILGDNNKLPVVAPITGSNSRDGRETSLAEDTNCPHPDFWIPFGNLECLGNPKISFPLNMRNDGAGSRDILMGSNRDCDYIIFGPEVGRYHCRLTLELGLPDNGPLRRQVVVKKIHTTISPSWLSTMICTGEERIVVEDTMVLPCGAVIQFGNGDRYVYTGPQLSGLYSQESHLYGGENLNSRVTRVQRRSDKLQFVAKEIPYSHVHMARKEILTYESLGYHPRIARFMESFYDFRSGVHNLILELGSTDLYRYISEKRPHDQLTLQMNASQWTRQITEGIAHMHAHGITHRDIKPQNILVLIAASGRVDLKVMDMGLAKQYTGPVTEQWFAGTPQWAAPGPFMAYKDSKLVDCYAIGRAHDAPVAEGESRIE